jgi:membrane fusion protein (multidrug efflux system)
MRRSTGFLPMALSVALCAAACGETRPEPTQAAPSAATQAAKSQTSPAPAAKADAPATLEILSLLSVEQEVDVLAQRRGIVLEIVADQGSVVQKGALLARLDDRQLVAQADRARADLEVSRNNVKFNEAELKAREAAYRRAQEMNKAGLNSEADLEEAEFRAKGARFDLDSWRSVVERSQADIRLLDLELEKTRIRAPFNGVVAGRYVRLGQDVLADEKCFRLSQLSPLLVRFQVPETSRRRPRAGDAVEIVLQTDHGSKYAARIQKVSPVVDAASGSYDVTAQLSGDNLQDLRPGMAVRVLWPNAPAAAKP